jgi:CheY-like chemotaxis protein
MPVMEGLELAREPKRVETARGMLVVMITTEHS